MSNSLASTPSRVKEKGQYWEIYCEDFEAAFLLFSMFFLVFTENLTSSKITRRCQTRTKDFKTRQYVSKLTTIEYNSICTPISLL
ncbi:hypothetical protein Scep_017141 [Stephania cephalantha]|uniref:Uncharacterized protein n=1 Tax=Stephania cephalantha TaxID=152367 RepID=A0AAP0NTY6_9MAGN